MQSLEFFTPRPRRRPHIEIIPMVDVMFLLLVFYILSSLALTRQQGISVQLPQAQTGVSAAQSPQLVVSLTRQGEVYLNRQKLSLSQLPQELRSWSRAHPQAFQAARENGLILQIDADCKQRCVVTLIDTLRVLELNHFVMATRS